MTQLEQRKECRQCASERLGYPEKGIHTCDKGPKRYNLSGKTDKEFEISLDIATPKYPLDLWSVFLELRRRYKELKKASQDYSEI